MSHPPRRKPLLWPALTGAVLAGALVWYALPLRSRAADQLPLTTLIVGGGPNVALNQYALGSNTRYVESLTSNGRSQKVLFADGNPESKSITTFEPWTNTAARKVFGWMFNEKPDFQGKAVLRRPGLKRLDGPSTGPVVTDACAALSKDVHEGEHALIYFTGHGSPDPTQAQQTAKSLTPAFPGTGYSLWGGKVLGVRETAETLQDWPENRPLVLVMVQCYSGGFANLIFKGGQPGAPVKKWDFAGFFSSTGDRPAAGCTPEVDEFNYQDFTTHFFAALSGKSREGKPVTGADLDKNGTVSMLEAYAWTNLHDESVDVPLCTSDFYLRQAIPTKTDEWMSTPYAKILAAAEPWQKSIIEGLATQYGLKNEPVLKQAIALRAAAAKAGTEEGADIPAALRSKEAEISELMGALNADLLQRFPSLRTGPGNPGFETAKPLALQYLAQNPKRLTPLVQAFDSVLNAKYAADIRMAKLSRFVRACRSVILQEELKRTGTPEQKEILARLRRSESRSPLH